MFSLLFSLVIVMVVTGVAQIADLRPSYIVFSSIFYTVLSSVLISVLSVFSQVMVMVVPGVAQIADLRPSYGVFSGIFSIVLSCILFSVSL